MKNIPMRFCGVSLRHNPARLKIEDQRRYQKILPPFGEPDSLPLGRALRRISGEGEIFGADCLDRYAALEGLYLRRQTGCLMLPHMPAIYAFLSELSMTAEPIDDVLRVRFTFIEAKNPSAAAIPADGYLVALENDSLWDISYRTGVPLDTLVRLNPDIPYIGSLTQGEKVTLC